jgi:Short C-terminal domain
MDDYIRQTVASSSGGGAADELSKLAALRDSGTISEDEFQAMKAKVVAG